ncbi:VOC family protein [Kordiimonas sp. SCSIO 12610]|uniref:VOC family protein n=1 Tax=Kordiimonas sp. SCSIO 12610 TaxID=2829597 RepID=UPI00210ED9F0|nr:VOC family protein [Kordiimonas sp. SCSIO 12610]UTW54731.1 VOC family protein [Kordiimonas sp. SCSIO 12610]
MARTTQSTTKAQATKTAPKTTAKKAAKKPSKVAKKQAVEKAPVKNVKVEKPAKAKATPAKKKTTAKPRSVSAVPKGYHTVTPSLIVRGAAAAIDFYTNVFDAKELRRTYASDGITIVNAVLKVGNSNIHLSDEMPAYGVLSPTSMGAATSALHVYLEDVDAVWARAVDSLSTVILPLENAYWGERSGKFIDPFGQVWTVSKKIENLSDGEIADRYQALTAEVSAEVEANSDNDEIVPIVDISEAIAKEAQKAEAEAPATLAS